LDAQGLPSSTIDTLLEHHTPTQIKLGFKNFAQHAPSQIARMILSGRLGYRRGFKTALRQAAQPPQAQRPSPPVPTEQEPPEEDEWQRARLQALQRLAARNRA
jgi:hypothetical protein